jgi:hypothetical protein
MRRSDIDPDSLNRRVKCNSCDTTLYPGATVCSTCGAEDIDADWNSLQSAYQKHDIGEAYFVGRVEQMGLSVEHWGIDMRHDDDGLIFDDKMDLRLWKPWNDRRAPLRWPSERDGVDMRGSLVYDEATIDGDPELYEKADELGLEPDEDRIEANTWDLCGLVDVKTKSNDDWMGKFNLRHLVHYTEQAAEHMCPAYVYMTMVDADAEQVGSNHFVTPITADWPWERLGDHYDPDSSISLSYGELKDHVRECPMVKRTFRAPDGNLVVTVADDHRNTFEWFTNDIA